MVTVRRSPFAVRYLGSGSELRQSLTALSTADAESGVDSFCGQVSAEDCRDPNDIKYLGARIVGHAKVRTKKLQLWWQEPKGSDILLRYFMAITELLLRTCL